MLAQLANATILTVGTTTADSEAGSFQVKVANPPGIAEDENIADRVVTALVEQFGDVLAVIQPVRFDAEGDPDYSSHTFALERKSLGESIGRDGAGTASGRLPRRSRGGDRRNRAADHARRRRRTHSANAEPA